MAFEPENPLEAALLRATNDPEARPDFYQLLMTSPLFLLGGLNRQSEDGSYLHLRVGDDMNLATLRHNGRHYHPAFTALTRLSAFAPDDTRIFTATGRDLFLCTKGAEFVLNPNSEIGKQLSATEIAFWLDPSARARRNLLRDRPQARLGEPSEYPQKVVDALRVLFANRAEVRSAYVLEVSFSDRPEPPHPLIAIETTGSWEKIYTEVSQIAGAVLPDIIIDVLPLDRTRSDDAIANAVSNISPFYERKPTE